MKHHLFVSCCAACLILTGLTASLSAAEPQSNAEQTAGDEARQARIQALEAVVTLQKTKLDRLRNLYEKAVVPVSEVRQAELELSEARLELAEAQSDPRLEIAELAAIVQLRQFQRDRLVRLQKKGYATESDVRNAEVALQFAQARKAKAEAEHARLQAAPLDPRLKKLMVERRDVLRERVKLATAGYRAGETTQTSVLLAMADLIEAELELAENAKQRIAFYEQRVDTMKAFEETARARFAAAAASRDELLAATAARLKAEIQLLRERSRAEKSGD